MSSFNALSELQSGVFGVLVALTAPERPDGEIEPDSVAREGEVSEPDFDLTDDVDPAEGWDWACLAPGAQVGFCLVMCTNDSLYRPVSHAMSIREYHRRCRIDAMRHCHGRGQEVKSRCFGKRYWSNPD